jgi:hypothetical protein
MTITSACPPSARRTGTFWRYLVVVLRSRSCLSGTVDVDLEDPRDDASVTMAWCERPSP